MNISKILLRFHSPKIPTGFLFFFGKIVIFYTQPLRPNLDVFKISRDVCLGRQPPASPNQNPAADIACCNHPSVPSQKEASLGHLILLLRNTADTHQPPNSNIRTVISGRRTPALLLLLLLLGRRDVYYFQKGTNFEKPAQIDEYAYNHYRMTYALVLRRAEFRTT